MLFLKTSLKLSSGDSHLVYSQNTRSTEFPLYKDLHIRSLTWIKIEAISVIEKINMEINITKETRRRRVQKTLKLELFQFFLLPEEKFQSHHTKEEYERERKG